LKFLQLDSGRRETTYGGAFDFLKPHIDILGILSDNPPVACEQPRVERAGAPPHRAAGGRMEADGEGRRGSARLETTSHMTLNLCLTSQERL
jgi:hypothetical protein